VTQQIFYRWRKEYGGRPVARAKRMTETETETETENARSRRAVSNLTLGNQILTSVVLGNF